MTIARTLELDFVLDNAHDFQGNPTTREAILAKIGEHGLDYAIVTENGPAGGNPLVALKGTEAQLRSYMEQVYLAHDKTDLDWYLTFAK